MTTEPSHALRRAIDEIELTLFTGAPITAGEAGAVLDPLAVAASPDMRSRVAALLRLCDGGQRSDYLDRFGAVGVTRFVTSERVVVYAMAVETYPDHVNNVLLTADHVLPRTTPHLAPESVTPWAGLDHYLLSLAKVRRIAGIDTALPGHGSPIRELGRRIGEIDEFHRKRLDRVRAICHEPRTLAEISTELFGVRAGYVRILALEEAAAHVEYLARRGQLDIADVDELIGLPIPVVRYCAP